MWHRVPALIAAGLLATTAMLPPAAAATAATAVTAAAAGSSSPPGFCGATPPQESEAVKVYGQLARQHLRRKRTMHRGPHAAAALTPRQQFPKVDIDLYAWVVTRPFDEKTLLHDEPLYPGSKALSDDIIREQIDFLNNEFRNYSFAFHLKGTKRIANRDWAAGRDNVTMVRSIQKDAYNTLNVFFLDTLPDPRHAGVCSLPMPAEIRKLIPWDACLVRAGTVPGGRDQGINSGKVLVHEAGHWLGLLHPFDSFDPDASPCDGIGDAVDDTPAAGEMWFECKPHDSCPDQPGMDPIHNHMSYTPEDCRHEFTPGQTELMHAAWQHLRTPGPK